jgi:hypothetical protein
MIPLRQPLAWFAVWSADPEKRAAWRRFRQLVADELNVKRVIVLGDGLEELPPSDEPGGGSGEAEAEADHEPGVIPRPDPEAARPLPRPEGPGVGAEVDRR